MDQIPRGHLVSGLMRAFQEAATDVDALATRIAQGLVETLGADTCVVRFLSPDGAQLEMAAMHDRDPAVQEMLASALASAPLQVGASADAQALLASSRAKLLDMPEAKRLSLAVNAPAPTRTSPFAPHSVIAVPLRSQGQAFGSLSLSRRSPELAPFDRDDCAFAEEIAHHAAFALRALRLMEARARELDERRRAEQALAASESQYRKIVELARDGIWVIDHDLHTTFVNPAMAAMLGHTPEEMLGGHLFDHLFPEDQASARGDISSRQQGEGQTIEARLRRKDGSPIWVLISASHVRDDHGRLGSLAVMTNVTERRKDLERLAARESQLAEAQALAQVGSWDLDLDSGRLNWSEEIFRHFGLSPGEVDAGKDVFRAFVHPDDRNAVDAAFVALTSRGQPLDHEFRVITRDGSLRYLRARAALVHDREGRAVRVVGTGQDVTDRKHLEAQVLLAGRLASLGTLASGVAHEINNPLTYVLGNLELAATRLVQVQEGTRVVDGATFAELDTCLAEALHGARRVRGVVHDLGVFARTEEEVHNAVSVEAVLESSLRLAWNEIRHCARLVRSHGVVRPVWANEARLGQVFLNLLVNAAHAIPEGACDRHEIRVVTTPGDPGFVCVEVQDTGVGVPADVLPRMFDPFFTTKPVGSGTGLGLSICHGIIDAMGGRILCESRPGHGTTMRVLLPEAPGGVLPVVTSQPAVATGSSRGRLLAIDDEPMMLDLLRQMLGNEHDVVVARGARPALDALAGGQPFDVILCDLMMPDMDGPDLHAELLARDPALAERMVFLTGGAFTPRAQAFLERVPNPRLGKPFAWNELRDVVRRLLAS